MAFYIVHVGEIRKQDGPDIDLQDKDLEPVSDSNTDVLSQDDQTQYCPECETDLSGYSAPTYCPGCGAKI